MFHTSRTFHLIFIFGALFLISSLSLFESKAISTGTVNEIFIENFIVSVSDFEISYSATFVNQLEVGVVFDAIVRLDNHTETIALNPRTIELEPNGQVTVNGTFEVDEPGSYVVQWEALSPPPGEALADRRRVEVVVQGNFAFTYLLIAITAVAGAATVASVLFLRHKGRNPRIQAP